MEYRFLPKYVFLGFMQLALAVLGSHAAQPSEVYWQSVLPSTPMPKLIQDLLQPADSLTTVNVGRKSIGLNAANSIKTYMYSAAALNDAKSIKTYMYSAAAALKDAESIKTYMYSAAALNDAKSIKTYMYSTNAALKDAESIKTYMYSAAALNDAKSIKTYMYSAAASNAGIGSGPASGDQLNGDPNIYLPFLEEKLSPGTKMNFQITKSTTGAPFLPRQVADAIPFSSNKFSDIIQLLSIKPKSEEAEVMKEMIKVCETPAEEGEDKYCATSLESMIDFSISKLGKNVGVLSTELNMEETQKQQYSMAPGIDKVGYEFVACHAISYPYAVFYCHAVHNARAYMVPLVSADGKKAKVVSICHEDTSMWNPKHLAFQLLKVEPGTTSICHFVPEKHIIWVSK